MSATDSRRFGIEAAATSFAKEFLSQLEGGISIELEVFLEKTAPIVDLEQAPRLLAALEGTDREALEAVATALGMGLASRVPDRQFLKCAMTSLGNTRLNWGADAFAISFGTYANEAWFEFLVAAAKDAAFWFDAKDVEFHSESKYEPRIEHCWPPRLAHAMFCPPGITALDLLATNEARYWPTLETLPVGQQALYVRFGKPSRSIGDALWFVLGAPSLLNSAGQWSTSRLLSAALGTWFDGDGWAAEATESDLKFAVEKVIDVWVTRADWPISGIQGLLFARRNSRSTSSAEFASQLAVRLLAADMTTVLNGVERYLAVPGSWSGVERSLGRLRDSDRWRVRLLSVVCSLASTENSGWTLPNRWLLDQLLAAIESGDEEWRLFAIDGRPEQSVFSPLASQLKTQSAWIELWHACAPQRFRSMFRGPVEFEALGPSVFVAWLGVFVCFAAEDDDLESIWHSVIDGIAELMLMHDSRFSLLDGPKLITAVVAVLFRFVDASPTAKIGPQLLRFHDEPHAVVNGLWVAHLNLSNGDKEDLGRFSSWLVGLAESLPDWIYPALIEASDKLAKDRAQYESAEQRSERLSVSKWFKDLSTQLKGASNVDGTDSTK